MDKEKLENLNAFELLEKARKVHTEIFDICEKSELPPAILAGILESVKQQLYAMANVEWTE